MALSGSFSANQRNGKETVTVKWSATQNVANNTSTVTAKLYFTNQYSLYIAARTHTITIAGTKYNLTSDVINTTGEHYIGSVSHTISHDADGTKSFSMSFVFSLQATLSGTYYESISGSSGSIALNTIPRASTFTSSVSEVYIGDNVTFTITRASSSFTHELMYSFVSSSGTIGTSIATSKTWTVPASLTNEIPNSTSGTLMVMCKTYKGSTLIGSKSLTIKIKVPSTIIPRISSITLTDPNGYTTKYGGYVQGKSKLKVQVNSQGAYSSTIAATEINALGVKTKTNPYTSNVIADSGTKTITATVTDSRGRYVSESSSINVFEYKTPIISKLTAYRCNASGTADEQGGYIKITANASISPINNKNSKTFTLKYKKASDASYTTVQTYTSAYTYSVTTNAINVGTENVVDIELSVKDDFYTNTSTYRVSTAYTLIDLNASGKGIGIGKVSEKNKLEIAIPIEVANVSIGEWVSLTTDSTCASCVTSTYAAPKLIRIGKYVSIRGKVALSSSYAGGTIVLYKIPSGYAPSSGEYSMNATGDKRIARIVATSGGSLVLDWIAALKDGSTVSGEITWIDVSISYFIN